MLKPNNTVQVPQVYDAIFTPMPYTRLELLHAMKRILGDEFVAKSIQTNTSLHYLAVLAIEEAILDGREPMSPARRVVQQAYNDYYWSGKFHFAEDR